MSVSQSGETPIQNRLLAALPREEYGRLRAHLEPISMEPGHVVYEPKQPIRYVYFPFTGIISLVSILEDGASVEAATIGNEGMTGAPVFLGIDTTLEKAFAQVPGQAVRMRGDRFKEEVNRSQQLRSLLCRYTHALYSQLIRSTACNRLHSAEQRCSRWLLMSHDRMASDQFLLTHEFLAGMLGVRRETVTVVAGTLQKAGLIRYRRGRITILDRKGLEAASCECYRVVTEQYNRLLA